MPVSKDENVVNPASASSFDYSNVDGRDMGYFTKMVQILIDMKNSGIVLSDDQEYLIGLYNKIEPEKFEKFMQYKSNSEERRKGQEELRDRIAIENEEKEEWYNSEENPTNIRKKELERMKNQIEALEQTSEFDSAILSTEQKELLERGQVFFDMLAKSNEGHEVDTGMNPEIREWYKETYGKSK